MNQELDRLKKLRDHIVGIEMHITLVQSDLNAVERDIQFLQDLALVLRENLEVLKTDGIIAIASEYKKVVEEAKTVEKNLEYYFNLKQTLSRDLTKYDKIRADSLYEFENLKRQIDNRKVILLFDPSKRKK